MKRNPAARTRHTRLFPASPHPSIPASLPPPVSPSPLATGLAAIFGAASTALIFLILSTVL